MQISEYTFGLRGHDMGIDFYSMCENGVKNHIKSIQFAMAKTVLDIDFDKIGFDEAVAEKIHKKLIECGFSVPVLGCYINPIDEDAERLEQSLRRFEAFIQYASVFGAGVVGTETGIAVSSDRSVYRKNYLRFVRNLERLLEKAEQFGVCIGIEPTRCGAVCSPQVVYQIIRDMGSDKIKVILDLSNMLAADTVSFQRKILDDSFELFGNRIQTVHLKDFNFVDGKKQFAAPCEGMMDIPHLFELLSGVREKPAIILDKLKLDGYSAAIERLERHIFS